VRRIVVGLDGKIYDIEEAVTSNGEYAVLHKRVLVESASQLGIFHFGEP